MMGEGGGNGASWWEGRVWAEMRTKMSNSAERQWTKQREMSKIAKRDVCKLFCQRFVSLVREAAIDFF